MTTILIILLLALQVADWWTTREILANGGRELNPIVQRFITWFGYEWGVAAAKIVVAVILLLCLGVASVETWWWPWVLAVLLVWYVGVVAWNVSQIRKG